MATINKPIDTVKRGKSNHLIKELNHDPYHSKLKLKEPTVCPDCGGVYLNAKWVWREKPEEFNTILCPACKRISDKVPAAYLSLSGAFYREHQEEILHLIKNNETNEKASHPLKRIMDIEEQNDTTLISYTDAHLARSTGDALHRAYKGELDYQYTNEDIMLRVFWQR